MDEAVLFAFTDVDERPHRYGRHVFRPAEIDIHRSGNALGDDKFINTFRR